MRKIKDKELDPRNETLGIKIGSYKSERSENEKKYPCCWLFYYWFDVQIILINLVYDLRYTFSASFAMLLSRFLRTGKHLSPSPPNTLSPSWNPIFSTKITIILLSCWLAFSLRWYFLRTAPLSFELLFVQLDRPIYCRFPSKYYYIRALFIKTWHLFPFWECLWNCCQRDPSAFDW